MTKTQRVSVLAAIIATVAVGWCAGHFLTSSSVEVRAEDPQASGIDVETLRTRLGLSFAPVDSVHIQAGISRDEAITRARDANAHVQEATSVDASLGHLSNAPGGVVVGELREPRLVWLVAFQGLNILASGEPGSAGKVAHEYNVVIDAATGEPIMSFIYR